MATELKPAGATQLAFVRQCAVDAYTQYIDAIGKAPAPMVADFDGHLQRQELYLISANSRKAGYVVWWTDDKVLFVDNIAIAPDFQGMGLARSVFDMLEEQARANGLACIELYTNAKMTGNLALYPHLGFVEFARRTEKGFDRVYFRKTLTVT